MITYNHELYIKEAIEGVLMQQGNFILELIIANDCSSDKTDDIIKNILESDLKAKKIKYISHNENIGMQNNFVSAFNLCDGKYIALCEGDDYWTDPLKLQKQVDFLEGNEEFSGCFHSTLIIDEVNSGEERIWRSYTKNLFTIEDTFSKLSLFHTSSFLFKREVLTIPKWFNKIVSGDMALFALIASKGPLYFIDEPMSVYRKNESGVTNSLSKINYHKSRVKLFEYLNKELNFQYDTNISEVISYHKKKLKNINKNGLSHLIKRVLNKLK